MSVKPRALIVEDEMLVAMLIEDALMDGGFEIMGISSRVEEAKKLLALEEQPDVAVMDLNLAGTSAVSIAEYLISVGIPFVIVSGYGREGLPRHLQNIPMVSKPFNPDRLLQAMRNALADPPPKSIPR